MGIPLVKDTSASPPPCTFEIFHVHMHWCGTRGLGQTIKSEPTCHYLRKRKGRRSLPPSLPVLPPNKPRLETDKVNALFDRRWNTQDKVSALFDICWNRQDKVTAFLPAHPGVETGKDTALFDRRWNTQDKVTALFDINYVEKHKTRLLPFWPVPPPCECWRWNRQN